jgi:hypothetical protein
MLMERMLSVPSETAAPPAASFSQASKAGLISGHRATACSIAARGNRPVVVANASNTASAFSASVMAASIPVR